MGNSKTVYITVFEDINVAKVKKWITACTQVIEVHKPMDLYFLFASTGGEVDAGFVLYNYLVSLQQHVAITMHNTGLINSMANVVFMAGQKRYAAPNASFLYHGIKANMNGEMNIVHLREMISSMEGMEKRISQTISGKSKMTEDELKELFHQGQAKDVQFALDKGIIHEIKVPSVPPDSIMLTLNLS